MPTPTDNHNYDVYEVGEAAPWSHGPMIEQLEVDVMVRGPAADRANATAHANAMYWATDTGQIYLGDGSSWNAEWDLGAIGSGGAHDHSGDTLYPYEVSPNQVFDSTGRYLGELTGSNDAQVVIDAIADRVAGAGLIIPDPGFDLDWEQQVDLPAEERGFSIQSLGLPTLAINSSYTGSYAFHKPASTAGNSNLRGYRLGGFDYDDSAGGVLDFAIRLDDIHESVIRPSLFDDCPGIQIGSSNQWSNQNWIERPNCVSSRGPCVHLTNEAGGTADQNWIVAPLYNEQPDSNDNYTEIAYIDEGKHNSWLYTRCEWAHTVHEMRDCRNYKVIPGNWDRSEDFTYTIRERDHAHGTVYMYYGMNYATSHIVSPNTNIEGVSDNIHPGALSYPTWTNIFEPLSQITGARTLGSMGLRDNSSGGSVSVGPSWARHPFLEWSTGATGGNTAVLDIGAQSIDEGSYPKVGYEWVPGGVGGTAADDDGDVVVRHGFYQSDTDRCELIYDPNNALGNHTTANWFFEHEVGGVLQDRIDTGISPAVEQEFMIARERRQGVPEWVAVIDRAQANEFTIADGGTIGQSTWRWSVETTSANDATWRLRSSRSGHCFWRM